MEKIKERMMRTMKKLMRRMTMTRGKRRMAMTKSQVKKKIVPMMRGSRNRQI